MDRNMNKAFRGISSSRAITELRDAPVAAAHAVRLDSLARRSVRYMDNSHTLHDRLLHAESYMSEAVAIVQRVRELAVRGSNGTFSQEDLINMAVEVDVLLDELVMTMNARGGDGQYLFAGDATAGPPFQVQNGRVPELGPGVAIGISYSGDISRSCIEIGDQQTVDLNLQGNRVFWAEQQQVFGARDTEGFTVTEPNRFLLDGQEVHLEPGDNIFSVMRKINDSGAAVKANLDPVTGSLNLATTLPHQIWLEPVEGTVLSDLGLLRDAGNSQPPHNWHPDTLVSGGGLYDQVMGLRDALLNGDSRKIGGTVLGGLDMGLENLMTNLADLGATEKRLEMTAGRLDAENEVLVGWKSRLADIDLTEAITALSMMEYTQKAAYQAAGRILQTSLMDFLR